MAYVLNNIKDISNICRACLKKDETISSIMNVHLINLFSSFTNLEVSAGDNLPSRLCSSCVKKLNSSTAFRQLCIKNDSILRQQKEINAEGGNIEDEPVNHVLIIEDPEREHVFVTENLLKTDRNNICTDVKESTKNMKIHRVKLKKEITIVKRKSRKHAEVTPEKKLEELQLATLDYNLYLRCPKCGEEFAESVELDSHYWTHLLKKPEVCQICKKTFSKPQYLKGHMTKHLRTDLTCSHCGKRCASKFTLQIHEKIHSDVRSYVCDICGGSFNYLKAHMLSKHSVGRPYFCTMCPKTFKMPQSLKIHLLRHTGVKKFSCGICGHATVTKAEQGKHMASAHSDEKPFACKICTKRCKTSGQLLEHNRIHTGERPFKCDLCPSTFRLGAVLKKHRMTHTGEKPFVCTICERAFTQRTALRTHMKIHKQ